MRSLPLLLISMMVACEAQAPAPPAPPPAPPAPAPPPVVAAPAPAKKRIVVKRPDDADSVALRQLAEKLSAPGARLENPCTVSAGPQCLRTALDPFFEALDVADSSGKPTVVLALGNSMIAGDGVVDIVRARLQARYGDAGRGFLLADRMASYGGRSRCAAKASGWTASTFAPPYKFRWPFGVSGVHHTSNAEGATSTFTLQGETRADIWWLDRPEAAAVDVFVDDRLVTKLEPQRKRAGRREPLALPPDAKELTLVARGEGAVLHGVVLEKEQSGVVLDMLGVPSSDASIFLQADEAIFLDQVRSRGSSLVLLMFGGNETKRIAWGRSSQEKVMHDLRTLIARVREARPGKACWVIGPLDSVVKRKRDKYVQRPELERVIAMERKIALEEGCAWFDLFAAMGGTGSVKRFDQAGLMHDDLVHPKGKGLDLLGQLIVDALFDEYARARTPHPETAEAAIAR